MLLNLTNHPSANWSSSQLTTATKRWETVQDMAFPDVPPDFDEKHILQIADMTVKEAIQLHPDAVLCQGEMTLTFTLVSMFQSCRIPVYAATTFRQSKEVQAKDGTTQKQAVFRFIQFRKYPTLTPELFSGNEKKEKES